jgi:hypothetical protein
MLRRPLTRGWLIFAAFFSQITTTTREETSALAYAAAAVLCFFGLWCGCACIPLCMDSLKSVNQSIKSFLIRYTSSWRLVYFLHIYEYLYWLSS